MKHYIKTACVAVSLLTLVGCGKSREESVAPQPTLLSLPVGLYHGTEGEIFDINAQAEKSMFETRDELSKLNTSLASLETSNTKNLPRFEREDYAKSVSALKEKQTQLKTSLEKIEKEILVEKFKNMSFKVSKDGRGGYVMTDLSIETLKDSDPFGYLYEKNTKGEIIIDKNGNQRSKFSPMTDINLTKDAKGFPVIVKGGRQFDFGENPSSRNSALNNNGAISFNTSNGNMSFSFSHGSVNYVFEGRPESEQAQGRNVTALGGSIRVALLNSDEPVQKGTWKVFYKTEADLAREVNEAEQAKAKTEREAFEKAKQDLEMASRNVEQLKVELANAAKEKGAVQAASQARLSELSEKAKSEIDGLKKEIEKQKTESAAERKAKDAALKSIEDLQKKLVEVNASLEKANREKAAHETKISELSKKIETLNKRVESLLADVDKVKKNIEAEKTLTESEKTAKETAQKRVTEISAALEKAKAEMVKMSQTQKTLTDELRDADGDYEDLVIKAYEITEQLIRAEEKIAELEEELNKVRKGKNI